MLARMIRREVLLGFRALYKQACDASYADACTALGRLSATTVP